MIVLTRLCCSQGFEQNNDDNYQYGTMSQSVVLECQQGSEVWLQSDSDTCYIYGAQWSTFGGFLLQEL